MGAEDALQASVHKDDPSCLPLNRVCGLRQYVRLESYTIWEGRGEAFSEAKQNGAPEGTQAAATSPCFPHCLQVHHLEDALELHQTWKQESQYRKVVSESRSVAPKHFCQIIKRLFTLTQPFKGSITCSLS